MLTIIDEWTRECLAIDVARRLRSDDVLYRLWRRRRTVVIVPYRDFRDSAPDSYLATLSAIIVGNWEEPAGESRSNGELHYRQSFYRIPTIELGCACPLHGRVGGR